MHLCLVRKIFRRQLMLSYCVDSWYRVETHVNSDKYGHGDEKTLEEHANEWWFAFATAVSEWAVVPTHLHEV